MNKWKFKEVLDKKGCTQKDLSRLTGIGVNTLSCKLNGKRCFTTKEIKSICDTLEIRDCNEIVNIFLQ